MMEKNLGNNNVTWEKCKRYTLENQMTHGDDNKLVTYINVMNAFKLIFTCYIIS